MEQVPLRVMMEATSADRRREKASSRELPFVQNYWKEKKIHEQLTFC